MVGAEVTHQVWQVWHAQKKKKKYLVSELCTDHALIRGSQVEKLMHFPVDQIEECKQNNDFTSIAMQLDLRSNRKVLLTNNIDIAARGKAASFRMPQ